MPEVRRLARPLLPIFEIIRGLFVPSPISSRAVTDVGSDSSEP